MSTAIPPSPLSTPGLCAKALSHHVWASLHPPRVDGHEARCGRPRLEKASYDHGTAAAYCVAREDAKRLAHCHF